MLMKRKQYLTLLELLLVIAILGIAAGFIGINIRKALHEQRFKTETSVVVENLRLAQDLMLLLDTDVSLQFATDRGGQGIRYWLVVDQPPNQTWIQELQRKKRPLRTIRSIEFLDELQDRLDSGHLEIRFNRGGFEMSKGVMRLSDSSDRTPSRNFLERFICLPGYPQPITASAEKEKAYTCGNGEEQGKYAQLTLYTAAEIQDVAIQPSNQHKNDAKVQPKTPSIK